jgi:prevent-host-death family protein
MKTVGIFDARNRLSELVAAVEKGENVVLTRHGRPVAQLVPVRQDEGDARAAMDWLLSRKWRLHGAYLHDLVNEGRR